MRIRQIDLWHVSIPTPLTLNLNLNLNLELNPKKGEKGYTGEEIVNTTSKMVAS